MKKLNTLALALLAMGAAGAQEVGRVLSSTAVVQQVSVPRQSCVNETVGTRSPGGAAAGALFGGILGNSVGHGSGRAAATVLGVLGGAMLGDRLDSNGRPQVEQRCTTQNFIENRTVAYNVVYEYAGKQYSVQMPSDPGPTVQLQVSPVGALPAAPVAPAPQTYVIPPAAAPLVQYVEPAYAQPYRPPFVTSISISGGGHGGHHHGGHWPQHGYWR